MKRAWEYDYELIQNAVPKMIEDSEKNWEGAFDDDVLEYSRISELWWSNVPGSNAPEQLIIAAILSMYNMGYDVTSAEALIPSGISAFEAKDKIALSKITGEIFHYLNTAPIIKDHPHWKFPQYNTFTDYESKVDFQKVYEMINEHQKSEKKLICEINYDDLYNKNLAGWTAQIVGGALGTAIEGYCTKQLKKAFGEIRNYVREPNTYNDDITYEIAFLEAFKIHGIEVTSKDIALEWLGRIPRGWSAEDVALRNLRLGIFPPESAKRANPYQEWIGAQMRGAVCGMVCPGDPKLAADFAFRDAQISHCNSGILGEVFNSILISLSYVLTDCKLLVKTAIDLIPSDSEYYSVISFAFNQCESSKSWEEAWIPCEDKFKEFDWIHSFPNAAAEVISIYFSENKLDECLHIIAMEGQDVDCNAAQVATIFGIMNGMNGIDKRWTEPLGDDVQTYMRGYEKTTLQELAKLTTDSSFSAFN
ncbi:ADP-ribosylation/crystallin J1 [Tritrichomonas foetus]|uniref:ADP-ribosylation/crystallin J1 n=1 Tax=Tritrichomonas foetus TaxID=1144522 RepID=A0A1J4K4D0_9EUKA|nr:ADP-ribosylation/crystallin J1 [Tritrichomonas foetus]|eukprot:OHT06305.1 ADP-ribosylation/crystallin J1 [Tritrichomonas foetus]